MNDRELADKVVALGIGKVSPLSYITFDGDYMGHSIFVRDWRVAGALMEKLFTSNVPEWDCNEEALANAVTLAAQISHRDESLPRAIIEACVQALENNDE